MCGTEIEQSVFTRRRFHATEQVLRVGDLMLTDRPIMRTGLVFVILANIFRKSYSDNTVQYLFFVDILCIPVDNACF